MYRVIKCQDEYKLQIFCYQEWITLCIGSSDFVAEWAERNNIELYH